jgi:hypothetical protein
MKLLIRKQTSIIVGLGRDDVGRLLTPRHYSDARSIDRHGLVWACDNDAYSGFNETRYLNMLSSVAGARGCRFVTAPDVVGDADATLDLFDPWRRIIREHGLPVALVAQDGLEDVTVPWHDLDALFIGGTTEFKLSEAAADLARQARARGKWVHMGRVNSVRRLIYAREVGCHSVDGSGYAIFLDDRLAKEMDVFARAEQLRLLDQLRGRPHRPPGSPTQPDRV